MSILVTGSTGFIGNALVKFLYREGYTVKAVMREKKGSVHPCIQEYLLGDLTPQTDWIPSLEGVDTVIHLAARAHIMRDKVVDSLAEYRIVNTASTLNLAKQSADAGVRRFIFVSSIGVNGNQTTVSPFSARDKPNPREYYAISKYEAEIGVQRIGVETGMDIVVIRPTLVYGANAPGNFGKLLKAVYNGIPLPLGAIHNKRSLVSLDSLIDLIATCVEHPKAANRTFLVSDGEDLSTTELLVRLSHAFGKPVRLIPVPPSLISIGALILGKEEFARRLCGSLQVDISDTKRILGWNPPIGVDEGLKIAAEAYLDKSI